MGLRKHFITIRVITINGPTGYDYSRVARELKASGAVYLPDHKLWAIVSSNWHFRLSASTKANTKRVDTVIVPAYTKCTDIDQDMFDQVIAKLDPPKRNAFTHGLHVKVVNPLKTEVGSKS